MLLPPTALGLAAIVGAVLAAPRPADAVATLLAPTGGPPTAVLVAALGLLAQALAAWLLLVVLLTLGARVPSAAGRACRAVLHRCAPAAVRRGVALTLGAGLALGLAPPAAATTLPAAAGTPSSAAARSAGPALDWPGLLPDAAEAAPVATAPAPPADEAARAPASVQQSPPPRATTTPALPRAAVPRPIVVVRPGDTLWELTDRSLAAPVSDADRAAEWPRWWAANRAVVGDDPDLLRPGQRLVAPPAR